MADVVRERIQTNRKVETSGKFLLLIKHSSFFLDCLKSRQIFLNRQAKDGDNEIWGLRLSQADLIITN